MTRKISALLTLFCLLSPLAANASLYFSGFYTTLGLGGTWVKGKHKFTDPNGDVGQAKLNTINMAGSLHLGYITEINVSTVMVGGEIYYMIPTYNHKFKLIPDGGSSEGDARIHRKSTYGAAFIAGVLLNPKIIVYGKLAFDIAPTEFKYSNLTFGNKSNINYKHSYKKFVPGVGFRYAIGDRFHIGAEYDIAVLGRHAVRSVDNPQYNASVGIDTKLIEQRFMITLTYQLTSSVSKAGSPRES